MAFLQSSSGNRGQINLIFFIIRFMDSLEAFMQPMVGSPLVYSMNSRVIEAYDIEND